MKGGIDTAGMGTSAYMAYATVCGRTLARAHAQSRDVTAIARYLGESDTFDQAISRYSITYAAQAVADYEAVSDRVRR